MCSSFYRLVFIFRKAWSGPFLYLMYLYFFLLYLYFLLYLKNNSSIDIIQLLYNPPIYYFLKVLFIRESMRWQRSRGGGTGRLRAKEWETGIHPRTLRSGPWDHDLRGIQMLTWLSHPQVPPVFQFKVHIWMVYFFAIVLLNRV